MLFQVIDDGRLRCRLGVDRELCCRKLRKAILLLQDLEAFQNGSRRQAAKACTRQNGYLGGGNAGGGDALVPLPSGAGERTEGDFPGKGRVRET